MVDLTPFAVFASISHPCPSSSSPSSSPRPPFTSSQSTPCSQLVEQRSFSASASPYPRPWHDPPVHSSNHPVNLHILTRYHYLIRLRANPIAIESTPSRVPRLPPPDHSDLIAP
ncbi:hypothetical protein FRB95_008809 [Tulasnella sp. JGI-2019a]|nr:hypothetical protein FRB93_008493 [Tulasnella sp. JGI-2019a]KAG9026496.1 hypothetical protein FRB95_008809 [Tulasnella sp. JGI-2019a]